MSFALLIPFMFVALVANLTELNRQYRWITFTLLILGDLVVLLAALASVSVMLLSDFAELPLDIMPFVPRWGTTAAFLAVTAILALLPLFGAVRRLLARWLDTDPESSVHTTALVFAIYLVGLTLSQIPLMGGLEGLGNLDIRLGSGELWAQALALLLLGLIGVGLGLRRNAAETADRLGLRWPSWKAWLGILGLLILFQSLDFGVAMLWQAWDPATYELIGRISESLFGGFMTPLGALAVGIAAGVSEETLFRGALQPRFGILVTSLLFAVSHLQYAFTPATLVILIIGLSLGWVRKRWGLPAAIALHALYNIVNLLLSTFWP